MLNLEKLKEEEEEKKEELMEREEEEDRKKQISEFDLLFSQIFDDLKFIMMWVKS